MNREDLIKWINNYLTERFIAPSDTLPKDECRKEAETILDKVLKGNWVDKPTDDYLWIFKGAVRGEDRERILLCITSLAGLGFFEIAHLHYGDWIPTTTTSGAMYLYFDEVKGKWSKAIVPEKE